MTMYFCDVSPSSPTGPLTWNLPVLIPISAPKPYSNPSAKPVEALTITEDESTSDRNFFEFDIILSHNCIGMGRPICIDM